VPGGVGPLTIALLLKNTVMAAARRATGVGS
jgi:5,10-methylene-tetrahydrofolate dehydrogenase/methenyl tetrahydrofolate cyclohydrolase